MWCSIAIPRALLTPGRNADTWPAPFAAARSSAVLNAASTPMRFGDRKRANVTDCGNVSVADEIVIVVKEDAFHRAVALKIAVVLFARDAQNADVELPQSPEMRGRRLDRRSAKPLT